MSAEQLERLMVKQFGPDFRRKAIVGPTVVFHLAGVFEECGLEDPHPINPTPMADMTRGLWQILPVTTWGRAA